MPALNHYLFWISFVFSVVVGVTVLFAVFPAYWRSHDRAFLYLAFAYMVSIFDAVADHTIALWHVPRQQYLAYLILRRLVHFAAVILFAVGVVRLTRSYFMTDARDHDTTPVA
jgi:hypothetical protein